MSSYTSTPITVSNTARSIVDVDNPTSGEVASQTNNELYKRLATLKVTDESKTYFNFVENNLGVRFNVFLEEPVYERNFTNENGDRGSYPGDQTARYHMVGMLLSGSKKHGFTTPLRNDQIKSVHKELTDEKIDLMRSAYVRNESLTPFQVPVRATNLTNDIIEKLRPLQDELLAYVNAKSPLTVRQPGKYNAGTYDYNKKRAIKGFSGMNQPPRPVPGDTWFDTKRGLRFVYVKINNSAYWMEM